MSKTPYEVRLDVMALAQRMLEQEYNSKRENFSVALNHLVNVGYSPETVKQFINDNEPKVFTAEDLLEKSQTLYSFVSDSNGLRSNK